MLNFKEIDLGSASAEKEGAKTPLLLTKGFLDHHGIIRKALREDEFIFLGYKGAGKSAIGEHIRLEYDSDPNMFITVKFLSDFPYKSFSKIVSGSSEPESKFPTAWSWILCLNILKSFRSDEGAISNDNTEYIRAIIELEKMGLLPSKTLKDLVAKSSKVSFKIAIPNILEAAFGEEAPAEQDIAFMHLVDNIVNLALEFKSESNHILILDGLDDILTQRDVQYQALSALVLEVTRLNNLFSSNGTPAKILLMCRTELYEKLPGPNKNKTRQDYSIELDWYHDTREPEKSMLIDVINTRSKIKFPQIDDVFEYFLESHIDSRPTKEYLLDMTRHTPRDFIQLMKFVQDNFEGYLMTRAQILSGLRQYSIKYFMPEIKDEMAGYVSSSNIDVVMRAIASIGKRHFTLSALEESARRGGDIQSTDLMLALDVLFECSAIGNLIHKDNGNTYYSFNFRNKNSSFNPRQNIILHRGMWKAMNLV